MRTGKNLTGRTNLPWTMLREPVGMYFGMSFKKGALPKHQKSYIGSPSLSPVRFAVLE